MNRPHTFLGVFPVLALALALGQPALGVSGEKEKKDPPQSDLQKLQGTWLVVSDVMAGKPNPRARGGKFHFQGNKLTLEFQGKKEVEITFRLFPTKSPKWIDGVIKGGANSDIEQVFMDGIYDLKGNELKICIPSLFRVMGPAAHPSSFSATASSVTAGSANRLFVLKRKVEVSKKGKAAEALKKAEEAAAAGNTILARIRCRQIIAQFPNTPEAEQAKMLLEKLKK